MEKGTNKFKEYFKSSEFILAMLILAGLTVYHIFKDHETKNELIKSNENDILQLKLENEKTQMLLLKEKIDNKLRIISILIATFILLLIIAIPIGVYVVFDWNIVEPIAWITAISLPAIVIYLKLITKKEFSIVTWYENIIDNQRQKTYKKHKIINVEELTEVFVEE